MSETVHAVVFTGGFDRKTAEDWLATRGYLPDLTDNGSGLKSTQTPAERFAPGTIRQMGHAEHGMGEGVVLLIGKTAEPAQETMIHRVGSVFTGSASDNPLIADFICSTDAVDSYGDVVVQSGIDLSMYRQNPVVLWNHNSSQPIGKAESVGFNKDGDLIARFRFADASLGVLGALAESVAKMVKAGFVNACSIGFTSTSREVMRDAEGRMTGIKFLKSQLREISVVPVPANHEALVTARSMSIPEVHLRTIVEPQGQSPRMLGYRRRLEIRERSAAALMGELPASLHRR